MMLERWEADAVTDRFRPKKQTRERCLGRPLPVNFRDYA